MKNFATRVINKLKRIYQGIVAVKRLKKTAAQPSENEVKKIVFMVHYIPSWIRHKLIYDELCASEKAEAVIVCVPSDITETNPEKNDIYNYFIENGYNAINAINADGSLLDLKLLKPDFVFQSRPYNSRMPKQYNSAEIASYTRLCNISYGTCLANNALYTVMNPDYFKDLSIYFTELPSAKRAFERMYKRGVKAGVQEAKLIGAANLEWMYSIGKDAKDNYPSLKARPRFLWTPRWSLDPVIGGSNFFKYKEFFLDYMQENGDVSLLIRPHPLMFNNFVENGDMTKQDETTFRKRCAEADNIEIDEMNEYADNFWRSDILITDISAIILDYFITGKPIIYCTSDIKIDLIEEMHDIIKGCYIANDEQELKECMQMLRCGEDPLKEERERLIEKYFSSSINGCARNIADALING